MGTDPLPQLRADGGVPQFLRVDSRAPVAATLHVSWLEQYAHGVAVAVLQECGGGLYP